MPLSYFSPISTILPNQVSGLLCWYKADTGLYQGAVGTTATVNNGDPIAYWQDLSGNGNHLIQATAAQRPTLATNSKNGFPSVQFDGVSQNLKLASTPSSFYNLNNFTLFTACMVATSSSLVSLTTVSNAGGSRVNFGTLTRFDYASAGNTAIADTVQQTTSAGGQDVEQYNSTPQYNNWFVKTYIRTGNTALGFATYQNNAVKTTFNSKGSTTGICYGGNDQTFCLSLPAFSVYKGNTTEFFLFNKLLAPNQITQMNTYLNTKYQIY